MQIKPETALVWFSPNIEIATLGFPLILDKKVFVRTYYKKDDNIHK